MEDNKILKYIYFIYSIEKDKNIDIEIDISSDFKFKNEIIMNKTDTKKVAFNIHLYTIILYMSKINKNEKEIKIKLINRNDNQPNTFLYYINISDERKNIFIYDIEFKNLNNLILLFISRPPLQYNLSLEEKYEIFRKLCITDMEDGDKKENDNEIKMEDLIYYTQKKLEKEIKYNFSFFASVFNDINLKEEIVRHIEIFDINKIIFDDKKINFKFDVEKIIFYLDLINNRGIKSDKINHDLLCILLLLNKYGKNLIEEIFHFKYMKKFLYKILLEDRKKPDKEKLFLGLKLSKKIISDFIKNANRYKDISLMISYNDNFLDCLEIINKNFEIINDKLRRENENIKNIKLDNFIKPDIKDDLSEIKNQLEVLLILEKHFNIFLIEISSSLLEKYFNFHENDISELNKFLQIFKVVLMFNKNYKYIQLFEKLENCLQKGKLINMNLLLFIEIMPENKRNFDIKLLNNIDIDSINNEFIKKFREFNWEKILNATKLDIINEMCKLFKNIKNFGKIFLLFDFDNYIDQGLMNIIKDRFINLLDTYDEKECNNIIDDCAKLIYFLNIKNCELKSFFEYYFYNFFNNIAHQIFCIIYSKYKYELFNDELKIIIQNYYNNPENKYLDKSIYLSVEIENNNNFNINDLNDYYINYDDFFDIKNNNKFLLLEKIINKNLLNKECLKQFIEFTKNKIEEIIIKIKDGSVDYQKIKNYFKNDNNKNEFKNRLELILKFINKFDENKNLYNEIEEKINNINKIIEDLKLMEQKMNKYLKESKKEEIKEIQDLIIEIESYNLDYYLINKEQINKFLEQKEIEELPLNLEKLNFFFKIIYDETKIIMKDEHEIIKETNKKFNNLIIIKP